MSNMSDYLEGQIRAHIFRDASFTKPSTLAICLCTSAPSDSSTGSTITEVSNSNGYSRQTLDPDDANWSAGTSSNGLTSNLSAITFTASGGGWGTITHVAICDNATYGSGNMLFYGTLTASKTIADGDSLTFAISALSVTFA